MEYIKEMDKISSAYLVPGIGLILIGIVVLLTGYFNRKQLPVNNTNNSTQITNVPPSSVISLDDQSRINNGSITQYNQTNYYNNNPQPSSVKDKPLTDTLKPDSANSSGKKSGDKTVNQNNIFGDNNVNM